MLRIGIDCRFARRNAGLGRYTREVVLELIKRNDPIHYVLFVRARNETWIKNLPVSTYYSLQTTNFPHYSLQEQFAFPKIIKQAHIDLLFAPHFNVPLFCPVPFIVTIHDLILHRYPNEAGLCKKIAYRLVMRHAILKSKKIIAVSNFTAEEITSIYGTDLSKKIHVIGEGVQMQPPMQNIREKFDLQKPFFLYVGNAKQHKNVQMLIDAFQKIGSDAKELILVTGGKEAAHLRLVPGVHILKDVSEADLTALYKEASAFVTASLYEGYCLPVAEALSLGCPVIASDIGAIREIANTRALLIEPTVEAFATAMITEIARPSPSPNPSPSWLLTAEKISTILRNAVP